MNKMDIQPYKIIYEFRFKDNTRKCFRILLDPETLSLIHTEPAKKAEWMRLRHCQCECCPLSEKAFIYCPVAVNIGELTEEFKNMPSYDRCMVRCTTVERTYMKKTSIMEGLSSVFGVVMATSNCPILSFLKPLARFHLPFSSVEETVFRVTSFYLLGQYFECQRNAAPDLKLEYLNKHYKKVRMVNQGLMARLGTVVEKDADKNAINILFSLCQILSREIHYNLNSIAYLFKNRIPCSPSRDERNKKK